MRLRAIDTAMEEDRPAKHVVRELWADHVEAALEEFGVENEPLYLTLPGARGRDIELLVERGVIRLTETESVAKEDEDKVVGVERSASAVYELKKRFPGLRVVDRDIQEILRGDGIFNWPGSEDEGLCRARVVNLDLGKPLTGEWKSVKAGFSLLSLVEKLCILHEKDPAKDWTLFLTMNATIVWDERIQGWVKDFVSDNLRESSDFQNACNDLFGADFLSQARGDEVADLAELSYNDQQHFLMIFVPKHIAHQVHRRGWRVQTEESLCYGGGGGVAAMVTWIIRFTRDTTSAARPSESYQEALRRMVQRVSRISDDGKISPRIINGSSVS